MFCNCRSVAIECGISTQTLDMKRTLVIAAHPDDTEFICGGTIASMTANGHEVFYVVVTSGELGLPPEQPDPLAREPEQRAAADSLGVKSVTFLREPDGHVANSSSLRFKLVQSIRELRPQLVITHSPTYNLGSVRYSHPDHLAVGSAALASVFPESRNGRFHRSQVEQGLEPWTVREVWLCGVEHPNFSVDISHYFERKLIAAGMHESQKRHFDDFAGFFRQWAQEVAEHHSLVAGALAEEFHRITTT